MKINLQYFKLNALPSRLKKFKGFTYKNKTTTFNKLEKRYQCLLMNSGWFRFYRDVVNYPPRASQSEQVEHLQKIFADTLNITKKAKMLIVGVSNAQEPFSYLALMNELKKHAKTKNYLDLHCVDIQPKIKKSDLNTCSYYLNKETMDFINIKEYVGSPKYSPPPPFSVDSFDYDPNKGKFKIKEYLFNFLQKTFDNPKKTSWETDVVLYAKSEVKKYPEQYDIISCNQVLRYLSNNRNQKNTLRNLFDLLKPGGYLIAKGPEINRLMPDVLSSDVVKEVYPYIWKKQNIRN